ncbi:MAG: hypothetical protein IKW24_06470 [Clostridia bacterium]|nr:hypothetical protein [Clostridia bacterium]
MTDYGTILAVVLYVFAVLISLAVALASYILYSLGLGRICKKLGACRPLLAWIPLVRWVVTAKAADVALLKLDGKKKNLTKQSAVAIILALIIWLAMLLVVLVGAIIIMMISDPEGSMTWVPILVAVLIGLLAVAFYAFAIWYSVLWYIAFFRISRAFVPKWASWVLLIAQVLWPQLISIVMLVMSFFPVKEDGMIEGVAVEQTEQQADA